MPISLQIEEREHCLDSVGLWKPVGVPIPRFKACLSLSNWMDIIQTQTHAAERCPLPKVLHYVFLR